MNSPEYTTSAPVIGPLIMCSGLRVSAKPYHPRHRVAPSSRVVVARQSIDRSLESRLVSSRSPSRVVSSRRLLAHHFPHPSSSSIIIARRLGRVVSRVARVARVARTASTNPQFATGPQKCVVFGPVGPSMKARIDMIAPSPSSPSLVALCHREVVSVSQSSITLCHACTSRCARTARMETRGTGRASNGREITRWSVRGDVAIGADRGCVVVEVRTARATNATHA